MAARFADGGYKVVLSAPSLAPDKAIDGTLNIPADPSDIEDVRRVFLHTIEVVGQPNVAIFNGETRAVCSTSSAHHRSDIGL